MFGKAVVRFGAWSLGLIVVVEACTTTDPVEQVVDDQPFAGASGSGPIAGSGGQGGTSGSSGSAGEQARQACRGGVVWQAAGASNDSGGESPWTGAPRGANDCVVGEAYCRIESYLLPGLVPSATCEPFTGTLAACASAPSCACLCAHGVSCVTECSCVDDALGRATINCTAI